MAKHTIIDLIDKNLEFEQDDGLRGHLGGSLIGRKCMRELYYSFRWATKTLSVDEHTLEPIQGHDGRLLRLFNRGHLEEFRFVEWLRGIGIVVHEYDIKQYLFLGQDGKYITVAASLAEKYKTEGSRWEDVTTNEAHQNIATKQGVRFNPPKQFRISDVDGHFGGSLDAIMTNVPGVEIFGLTEEDEVLGEFKTHGLKSFNKLAGTRKEIPGDPRPKWKCPRQGGKGVRASKPEHYAQMQTYMHKRGIKLALYMAVCKDDDDLYFEWVHYDPLDGAGQIVKAAEVIHAPKIPDRMHGASASSFDCKFCDHYRICHFGEPLQVSCRTCISATPVENGQWECKHWGSVIPTLEHQKKGCSEHKPVTD